MNPSWYDLLDVPPDATEDQIKSAWKAAIADLDPTDRKFRVYNQAAEVLLDSPRRAAYDAERAAAEEADPAPELTPTESDRETARLERARSKEIARERRSAEKATRADAATPLGRTVPGWLLAVVAALTAVAVGACAYIWVKYPSDATIADSTRAAQSAAERAVEPILSYDSSNLPESKAAAESYLTSAYRKEYDQLFAGVIQENAPSTKTVVKADFLAAGIVRARADRVQILVLVNQSRTNKLNPEPVIFKNYVTMTMELVDGDWLVAGMDT